MASQNTRYVANRAHLVTRWATDTSIATALPALQEEWGQIQREIICSITTSMPRRCCACINAHRACPTRNSKIAFAYCKHSLCIEVFASGGSIAIFTVNSEIFSDYFIFANSVKTHICDVECLRKGRDIYLYQKTTE